MKQNRGTFGIVMAFCLLLTAFCSTTTMEYVWKDPNYQGGKLNKVLIIGVAKEQSTRILFENQFVEALKTYGRDAISSYSIIPSTENLDKATVESKLKTFAVEAVLVTKLVNLQKDRTAARITDPSRTQPRLQRGGLVNYLTHYELAQEQGSAYHYEVIGLETKIYDAQTDRLIWSGLSDTVLEDSVEVAIDSLIKAITKSLSQNQLI